MNELNPIDFADTKTAFAYRSTKELRESSWLFRVMGKASMVHWGQRATNLALRWHLPIEPIVKRTIYKQFCAGEDLADCTSLVQRLFQHRVMTILDHSIEAQSDENWMDWARDQFIESVQHGARNPAVPFAVFKPTAMVAEALLAQKSRGDSLSGESQKAWERFLERVHQVVTVAAQYELPLLVDAEETWVQPAVDELMLSLMAQHNRTKAIVFNTIQFYRVDRLAYFEEVLRQAASQGFIYGVKLVRGAYMEKERSRAATLGQPSPIMADKKATDHQFDTALEVGFSRLDHCRLFIGSHNQESVQLATRLMAQRGLAVDDPRVTFSQLFGMSDNISFNLAERGYRVAKLVPYGPIDALLPYLFRRAQENSAVRGQVGRELAMIRRELSRRRHN